MIAGIHHRLFKTLGPATIFDDVYCLFRCSLNLFSCFLFSLLRKVAYFFQAQSCLYRGAFSPSNLSYPNPTLVVVIGRFSPDLLPVTLHSDRSDLSPLLISFQSLVLLTFFYFYKRIFLCNAYIPQLEQSCLKFGGGSVTVDSLTR